MTIKKQESPLNLPSHEQLGQEAMVTYSLAMHSGEPSTREQRIAAYQLVEYLERLGVEVLDRGIVRDDPASLGGAL
jgi:hypothetical protein